MVGATKTWTWQPGPNDRVNQLPKQGAEGQHVTYNTRSGDPLNGIKNAFGGGDYGDKYTFINGQWVLGYWGKDQNGQWVGQGEHPGDPWSKGNVYGKGNMNQTQPATTTQPVNNIMYDPLTGLYVNKANGMVSTDPAGKAPVANLSTAQLAARNVAISQGFYNRLGNLNTSFDQNQAGTNAALTDTNNVIAGKTPSVAGIQLQQGLGQAAARQEAEASGVGGVNGALARQNAAQNIARLQVKTNQDAALLRAQEIEGARQQRNTLLNNQGTQLNTAVGQNIHGGEAATAAAQGGQSSQDALAAARRAQYLNLLSQGGALGTQAGIAYGNNKTPGDSSSSTSDPFTDPAGSKTDPSGSGNKEGENIEGEQGFI